MMVAGVLIGGVFLIRGGDRGLSDHRLLGVGKRRSYRFGVARCSFLSLRYIPCDMSSPVAILFFPYKILYKTRNQVGVWQGVSAVVARSY